MNINVYKCISSICSRLLIYVNEYTLHTEMLMSTFFKNIFGSSRKSPVTMPFMCVAAFLLSLGGKE